jgi:hypothetical protein
MKVEQIDNTLHNLFSKNVEKVAFNSWQIDTSDLRILVLISDDNSWLRILVPIAPFQDAQPFLEQILMANFDDTQEVRYAIHDQVIWGVFQHSVSGLTAEDFTGAIARLITLGKKGLDSFFNQLVEKQISDIIIAAKTQGQSLESTMQTLERFYQEGVMGDMQQPPSARQETLAVWRYQLERLWNENDFK